MKGSLALLIDATERHMILNAVKALAREQYAAGITKSPHEFILIDDDIVPVDSEYYEHPSHMP